MKSKVLVLTTTFPRWKNDTNPPFVYDLSQGLAKEMDVTVLTPHYPGAKNTEIMGKLKVHRFHYFFERFEKLAGNGGMLPTLKSNKLYYLTVPFFMLAEIIATIKLVRMIKPDVIHAHWILPQGLAAYINKLVNKTPYVVTSHGSDLHTLGLIALKRMILRNSKSITVVSNYLCDEIKKIDISLLAKTRVIPMGVDTKLFNPNKYDEKLKTIYGIKGPFLLYVGRLAPEKGVKNLIGAMPTVLQKYPKVKLMIIGSGTLELELKKIVKKLDIDASVIFIGALSHKVLPPFFATADIFVSPSINEGYGLTLIEAYLSGTYILASKQGISNELVKNNLIGVTFDDLSSRIIVRAITLVQHNNYVSCKRMSTFNWSKIIKEYAKNLV